MRRGSESQLRTVSINVYAHQVMDILNANVLVLDAHGFEDQKWLVCTLRSSSIVWLRCDLLFSSLSILPKLKKN